MNGNALKIAGGDTSEGWLASLQPNVVIKYVE
jgi:hypothetical protein